MKKVNFIIFLTIAICSLSGCSYSSVSVMDFASKSQGAIKRSCQYWSGVQKGDKIYLEEGNEVCFYIEMEKGKISFTLKDKDGNELYSIEKEGEYTGTEKYQAGQSGSLWFTEKGDGFKGK